MLYFLLYIWYIASVNCYFERLSASSLQFRSKEQSLAALAHFSQSPVFDDVSSPQLVRIDDCVTFHYAKICTLRSFCDQIDDQTVRIMQLTANTCCLVVESDSEYISDSNIREYLPIESRISIDALRNLETLMNESYKRSRSFKLRLRVTEVSSLKDNSGLRSYIDDYLSRTSSVSDWDDLHHSLFSSMFWTSDSNHQHAANLKEMSSHWMPGLYHDRSENIWEGVKNELKMMANQIPCDFSTINLSVSNLGHHGRVMSIFSHSLDRDNMQKIHACSLFSIAYFASRPSVYLVEVVPFMRHRNARARWILQSAVDNQVPYWDIGLMGNGTVIGVADTGVDLTSCFFENGDGEPSITPSPVADPITDLSQRKVVQYISFVDSSDLEGGHGSHVCGTAVGKSTNTSKYDGMAPESKLAFFDIGDSNDWLTIPDKMSTIFNPAYEAGARIHSNSWGSDSIYYLSEESMIDSYVASKKDFLVLFAAGNCGEYDELYCSEFYGDKSTGSPANMKNGMAIGASESGTGGFTDDIGHVAYFSSQGPSFDGRIKPDIVAPGYFTESCFALPSTPNNDCAVDFFAGTSMATPAVAGIAALVNQYLSLVVGSPSSALVRAVLLTSSVAMDYYHTSSESLVPISPNPNGYAGWGRPLLMKGLPMFNDDSFDNFVIDNKLIVQNQDVDYVFNIKNSTDRDFTATMCFVDRAGTSGSLFPQINDVNLVLTLLRDGLSTRFASNGNEFPDSDSKNTCERIVLAQEMMSLGDVVTLTVSGIVVQNTASFKQAYSIYAVGNFWLHNSPTMAPTNTPTTQSPTTSSPTITTTGSPSAVVQTSVPTSNEGEIVTSYDSVPKTVPHTSVVIIIVSITMASSLAGILYMATAIRRTRK